MQTINLSMDQFRTLDLIVKPSTFGIFQQLVQATLEVSVKSSYDV